MLFFAICREPSDWSEEDVQSLGCFLLLDGVALKTLPDRVIICIYCTNIVVMGSLQTPLPKVM